MSKKPELKVLSGGKGESDVLIDMYYAEVKRLLAREASSAVRIRDLELVIERMKAEAAAWEKRNVELVKDNDFLRAQLGRFDK